MTYPATHLHRDDEPHASYGWIVTVDQVTTDDSDLPTRLGWTGPHNLDPELERRLQAGEGLTWRVRYDGTYPDTDEDAVPYVGRIVFADPADEAFELKKFADFSRLVVSGLSNDEEADFGPLYDLGAPDVGASEIEYQAADGRWGVL